MYSSDKIVKLNRQVSLWSRFGFPYQSILVNIYGGKTTMDEISTQKDKTNIHGQYIIHHCFQEELRKIVHLFEQLLKD